MRLIGSQELLLSSQQDPYLRTHPFSRDRVQAIERHLSRSRYTDTPDTAEALRAHQRMIAKLDGFLSPVSRVLAKYPETDTSLSAAYARAVATIAVASSSGRTVKRTRWWPVRRTMHTSGSCWAR